MHRVTGPFGDDVSQQRPAHEGEVADEVKRLVPAALVFEPQTAGILDLGVVEADGIVEAGAADESHVAHLAELVFESKGARRRYFFGIAFGCNLHLERLPPDQRMIVEDVAGENKAVRRQDGNALAVGFHADRPAYAQQSLSAAV